jgi:hypothetical protein
MANETPAVVEASTVVTNLDGTVLNSAPKATSGELSSGEGLLNFAMYCAVKGIPVLHQAGMRAFTNLESATLASWDVVFKNY